MSIEAVLARGRAAAEARMISECVIRSPGKPVFDKETGKTESPRTTVYSGACEVMFRSVVVSDRDVQSRLYAEQSPELKLPVLSSADLQVGDEVEVTTNPHDPALVGVKATLEGIHAMSHATSRRLTVKVLSHG